MHDQDFFSAASQRPFDSSNLLEAREKNKDVSSMILQRLNNGASDPRSDLVGARFDRALIVGDVDGKRPPSRVQS